MPLPARMPALQCGEETTMNTRPPGAGVLHGVSHIRFSSDTRTTRTHTHTHASFPEPLEIQHQAQQHGPPA